MSNLDYREAILQRISARDYAPANAKQMGAALGVTEKQNAAFGRLLKEMEENGEIIFTKKEKIMQPSACGYVVGQYSSSDRGFGFVIPDEDLGGDVFIPARFTLGAMHGDRVMAKITEKQHSDDRRMEGELVRVLKRNTSTIIGRFENSRTHGFVVPDNKKYCNDIYVPGKDRANAKEGDKVVVQIDRYGEGRRSPEGHIIAVLGNNNTKAANYSGILYDHGIVGKFPAEVMKQAREIPQQVPEKDMEGRMDLREEIIFTIDGADSKDFDDAISIRKLENGNYWLGVHIADVSHYVTEGSPLDQEAFRRGTSVYFVDQVVPMLPVELSNGICSLNPKVDRLAFSCFMEIDHQGQTLRSEIGKSVIRSCERLVYGDVSKVLARADGELEEKYRYLVPTFDLMKELSDILFAMRERRGSINFDFPEAKIIVDEQGEPVDVVLRERGESDKIIEEFMLAANECVAKFIYDHKKPCVYRVHEKPNVEKTEGFLKVARQLGIPVQTDQGELTPAALQKVLKQIQGTKEERMLSTSMLRSLMKAQYFQENLGHFGLAATYYCHFTSPIRRYPDLAVHRILNEILKGGMTEKREKQLQEFAVEASAKSSAMELNAVDAERDIEDLYKAIFMSKFVGESFEGVISSVTRFGLFVELPNTIEGLVRVEDLEDDYYEYLEEQLCLVGTRTGKRYHIGDEVRVKLTRSDLVSREIDFVLDDGQQEETD